MSLESVTIAMLREALGEIRQVIRNSGAYRDNEDVVSKHSTSIQKDGIIRIHEALEKTKEE